MFTVMADYTGFILTLILTLSLLFIIYALVTNTEKHGFTFQDVLKLPYPERLPFATLSRTLINLLTAIAILAVDFTIFPRRLAKAETYGTGLMDVGVGTFVMAHGATAPEARYQDQFSKTPSLRTYFKSLVVTLRYTLPLFVLGLVRVVTVKSTDYQEHVTEYGVHWNFFFTIAVVRVSYHLNSHPSHCSPTILSAGPVPQYNCNSHDIQLP